MTIIIHPVIVDLEHAAGMVALSVSTLQALVRDGQFPAPIQLSGRRVGWRVRDIEAWADGRPASNLPPPANTGAKKARAA